METSPPLRLTSGELVYHRMSDPPPEGSGSPSPRSWFVIERPGRVELLVGLEEGMTIPELTRTLERVVGPAGALEVIHGFHMRVDEQGIIEPRAYRPGEPAGATSDPDGAPGLVQDDPRENSER
jgi:hypothetical protein